MTGVYLNRLSTALGELREEVEQAATVTAPAGLRDAGFRWHHRASPDTDAFALACRAVDALAPEPARVGALVHATCLPTSVNLGSEASFRASGDVKHLMEFPAARLIERYGFADAFPVGLHQQACTGFIGSLRTAAWILNAEVDVEQVLCVTADRFPDGARYEQAYNLISDGAAAALVSREPVGFRVIAAHHIANGALAAAGDSAVLGSFFAWMIRLLRELFARARIGAERVSWLVPQNTHRHAWPILARTLGIAAERVWCPTLPTAGHVIAADNALNLMELQQSGRLRAGDVLCLPMMGFGLNLQAVLLEAV